MIIIALLYYGIALPELLSFSSESISVTTQLRVIHLLGLFPLVIIAAMLKKTEDSSLLKLHWLLVLGVEFNNIPHGAVMARILWCSSQAPQKMAII